MSIHSAFIDELGKISKVVQKEFPFMKKRDPHVKPRDPYKKPKDEHIGTTYRKNPEGMSQLARTILDKIGRK